MELKTPQVHPTAVVSPGAVLEEGVQIGPYAVIGPRVSIGAGTIIGPHVVIEPGTVIGRGNRIHAGAVIGGDPQDMKLRDESTGVRIGDGNIIREYVTIHRAVGEGQDTIIGDSNYIMTTAHIGHNCRIGCFVAVITDVSIAGHVQIDDYAYLGGGAGLHQLIRVGRMAAVGGNAAVMQDVPPYVLAAGNPARIYGLNTVGMRRWGVPPESRLALKRAYRLLYTSGLNTAQAVPRIEAELAGDPEVRRVLEFLASSRDRRRGLTGWARRGAAREVEDDD